MNAAQRKRLSDQIRDAIRRSEMSQNEIARQSQIDGGTLSKFVTGERGLSLESIERLAVTLNLQIVEKD